MNLKTLQTFADLTNFSEDQKRDALWLVKELPNTLNEEQVKTLKNNLNEIKSGKPLAYILGKAPFFEFWFSVDESTLIPRFETELLVDKILKKCGKVENNFEILDLCAGSGAIGITLQKKLNCKVTLADINKNCLKQIKKNAEQNNANVKIVQSDMFKDITQRFDLIVSNPPYIKTSEIQNLDQSVKNFEPHLALDGGVDGLDFYKIIASSAPKFLKENGLLALEIGFDQGQKLPEILNKNFVDISVENDYSNLPRFVFAKRRQK